MQSGTMKLKGLFHLDVCVEGTLNSVLILLQYWVKLTLNNNSPQLGVTSVSKEVVTSLSIRQSGYIVDRYHITLLLIYRYTLTLK